MPTFKALPPVPTNVVNLVEWCRKAAVTINGLRNGSQPKPYVWTDYLSSINSARVAGSNTPTWAVVRDGIYAYSFSPTTMNEVWVNFHINHDVADEPNLKIYPHVHWTANSADTGTCRWGVEYTYAKGHQQGTDSVFPATTTIYIEQAFSGTAYEHHIAESSDDNAINIQTANIEVDGVIMMRVFRDAADSADTFTGSAFGIFVDMHVPITRIGTKNKSPNFYK